MQNFPVSIADVINMYCEYIQATQPEERAKQTCQEVRSGASRFWAPPLGFQLSDSKKRMKAIDQKATLAFLSTKSVRLLPKILGLMDAYFEEHRIKLSIRNTYGGRLRKVHSFAAGQTWYPGYRKSIRFEDECAPPLPGLGDMADTVLMPDERKKNLRYRLQPKETSVQLQSKLENLRAFCCAPYYPNRVVDTCNEETSDNHVRAAQFFLGWWIYFYQPELTPDDLSLQLLIPVITVDDLVVHFSKGQRKT